MSYPEFNLYCFGGAHLLLEFQKRSQLFIRTPNELAPNGDTRARELYGTSLISDALPFGRLWYAEPNAISHAIGYAKHRSRSHDALIRVYDTVGRKF
jgi:hypothetical protein